MRFGVFLIAAQFPGQTPGQVLVNTVEAIAAAERAGFDDAWIAEHHFMSYGVCPSAAALAGYALGRTTTIKVGTAVSVLSTQHPIALAEQAALLDQVSGGRFLLGVGRGGPWVDLEVFGTGLERFEYGFAEGLDLLCAALSGTSVSGGGPLFAFREVTMVPRPGRPIRPVVAATSLATATLAAERGLPLLLGMHIGDREKAALIAHYNAAAVQPADHVAAAVAFIGDPARLRQSLPRWLRPGLAGYVPVDGRARPRRDVDAYAELLCRIHPVGSADECVVRLRETARRTGLGHFIFMVEGTGDHARTLETIARLGAEVLPRLSSPPAQATGSGAEPGG